MSGRGQLMQKFLATQQKTVEQERDCDDPVSTSVSIGGYGRGFLAMKMKQMTLESSEQNDIDSSKMDISKPSDENTAPTSASRGRARLGYQLSSLLSSVQPLPGSADNTSVVKKSYEDSERPSYRRNDFRQFSIQNVADPSHNGKSNDVRNPRVAISTNYIRIKLALDEVFQYHVFFEPPIDSRLARCRIVYEIPAEELGNNSSASRAFDGHILYVPHRIKASQPGPNGDSGSLTRIAVQRVNRHTQATSDVQVVFKLVEKLQISCCPPLLNIIFKRVQATLRMVLVGRNYFQPANKFDLKSSNLEIWPGYVTSLSKLDGGLLMMCDVSSRVVRNDTVYDLMTTLSAANRNQSRGGSGDIKAAFAADVVNTTVLTRYNNRTYRIDDVAWSMSPESTFTNHEGVATTFTAYYLQHYNIQIADTTQPLLISKVRMRGLERQARSEHSGSSGFGSRTTLPTTNSGSSPNGSDLGVGSGSGSGGQGKSSRNGGATTSSNGGCQPSERMVYLIPELCYQTGLTDRMRSDFTLMRSLHDHTRASPEVRRESINKFVSNCNDNPECLAILKAWGLTLEPGCLDMEGYQLPPERILFGNGRSCLTGPDAEFKRDIGRNTVLKAVDINDWLVIFPVREERVVMDFLTELERRSSAIGMRFTSRPNLVKLNDDRTESFTSAIHGSVVPRQTDLVVCLFRMAREDRYNAIKKLLYCELGVANQILLTKTISDPRKISSVATNIALQINCKMGGELWAVPVPFEKIMVVGIDVYHEGNGPMRRSVGAIVGSSNALLTRYISQAVFQTAGKEVMTCVYGLMGRLLQRYYQMNNFLPETIFVYRDGVGDTQMAQVQQTEVKQLLEAFDSFSKSFTGGYSPRLVFNIVQKRVNTRFFLKSKTNISNVRPGLVVDHTVTRSNCYNFYIVPQSVRQGTCTPSHFVVTYDSSGLKPDNVQAMAYKLCHMYYNWPGTVRVPAPCQYAHKLAYMVGFNLRSNALPALSDKLFYL